MWESVKLEEEQVKEIRLTQDLIFLFVMSLDLIFFPFFFFKFLL